MKTSSTSDYSLAQALANASATLDEILPELKKMKEALSSNVLTAVMGTSGTADSAAQHVDMLLRHQRIAVHLSSDRELHRRTDLLLANLPVSEAEKSRLKEALMSSVQRFVQEHDERVRTEVGAKVEEVVAMVDPDARVAAVDAYLALAKTDIKQASHTWDSIQGTTSCGRIAFAKARDDVVSAFNEGVESLKSIFTSLEMYNDALSKLND